MGHGRKAKDYFIEIKVLLKWLRPNRTSVVWKRRFLWGMLKAVSAHIKKKFFKDIPNNLMVFFKCPEKNKKNPNPNSVDNKNKDWDKKN